MKKIGIFGGTFDPIHNGHLTLGAEARDTLGLDLVVFVVAGDPWQKENVTPAKVRYEMVKQVTDRLWWATVSDTELLREGPTYTIDTVKEMRALHPDDELFLLLGEDQFDNLHTWKDGQFLDGYCTLHPMPRWLNLSSTALRQRISEGKEIEFLVPQEVVGLIHTYQLYSRRIT